MATTSDGENYSSQGLHFLTVLGLGLKFVVGMCPIMSHRDKGLTRSPQAEVFELRDTYTLNQIWYRVSSPGYIVGLCRDNGKENGNYYNQLYSGITIQASASCRSRPAQYCGSRMAFGFRKVRV